MIFISPTSELLSMGAEPTFLQNKLWSLCI